MTVANECVPKFKSIVDLGAYLPQQVFNCEETGHFWKMSNRTHNTAKEKAIVWL